MLDENPEDVEKEISRWLQRSISNHDTLENFYHGFLAGLLEGFKSYEVKSNRENRDGRTDITNCGFPGWYTDIKKNSTRRFA